MSLDSRVLGALESLFDRERWKEAEESVVVEEPESSGEATLTCRLPSGWTCVRWTLHNVRFDALDRRVLGEARSADGELLLFAGEGASEIHAIELKKKVGAKAWGEARQQIFSSVTRLLAIAGILQVTVTRVVCYVGFREDRLSRDLLADPSLLKMPLGERDAAAMAHFEWYEGSVAFPGIGRATLVRVQLDPSTGVGSVGLVGT